jgi:hypothetical protein
MSSQAAVYTFLKPMPTTQSSHRDLHANIGTGSFGLKMFRVLGFVGFMIP